MRRVDRDEACCGSLITCEAVIAQLSHACLVLRIAIDWEERVTSAHSDQKSKTSSPEITLSQLSVAFEEVARMRKLLEPSRPHACPELIVTLSEYQQILRQFKLNLPRLRGWLLAERERLARRRSHSSSVESWIRASQQIRGCDVRRKTAQ
jgi:hypothetical protein